jgi:hypothetical protein
VSLHGLLLQVSSLLSTLKAKEEEAQTLNSFLEQAKAAAAEKSVVIGQLEEAKKVIHSLLKDCYERSSSSCLLEESIPL